MVTMGALVAAFALALVVNPRLRIRPSAYVFLLTLLLVLSVISSADSSPGTARCSAASGWLSSSARCGCSAAGGTAA